MMRLLQYGIGMIIMMGLLSLQQQQSLTKEVLLFSDDFSGKESAGNYIIEKSNKDTNAVQFRDGHMELDSEGGLTVWYREKLDVYKRQQYSLCYGLLLLQSLQSHHDDHSYFILK